MRGPVLIFVLLFGIVSWSSGQRDGADDLMARPRRERVVRGTSRRNTQCSITMRGRSRGTVIRTRVICNDNTLLNRDIAVGEISEQRLEHGVRLFRNTSDGLAFLYLSDESSANIVASEFINLPNIPGRETYAPVVIAGGRMDITNCTIRGNTAKVGGMAILDVGNVDLYNVSFDDNTGQEGIVVLKQDSRVDIELCFFTDNSADEVGAIKVQNDAITLIASSLFERNFGKEQANVIFITDDGTCFMEDSEIYGDQENEDFESFLIDNARPESDAAEFDLPFGGVAAITGRGTMLFSDSLAQGYLGRLGAFYAAGSPLFSALRTNFIGNRAITGGGLFANVERSGFARVLECNFTGNVARNGGALVFAGNGTYTIDRCHFENNTAINGGAVWGDYSEDNSCPRASSGSRVTILDSTFVENTAQLSGGAFYIRCTDIFARNSVFENNEALDGDGGCINAGNTFDLRFSKCSMSNNIASGSGGAIYVNGSNDIVMEDCAVESNSAGEDGGTIASLRGNGIIFRRSNLNNSAAGRHGGGIYASDLKTIRMRRTPLIGNKAGGRGGVFAGSNVEDFSWRSLTIDSNIASLSGAVHVEMGDSFDIRNVRFRKNEAAEEDFGAVHVRDVEKVTIDAVSFFNNAAGGKCGALSIGGASDVRMINTKLEDNEASSGGAMCMENTTSASVKNIQFLGNSAVDGNGGALMIDGGGNVSFVNVDFVQNAAAQSCGAISMAGINGMEIAESLLRSNMARIGGGICAQNAENVGFVDTRFEDNEAIEGNGGALHFTEGGSLSMTSVVVSNSTATESGGALFLEMLSSASMTDTTITNSSASIEAGCLYVASVTEVSIENSTFRHCEAKNGGAALFSGRSSVSGDDAVFHQNTAQEGGGAFMCHGKTEIAFSDSDFFHNAAREGSTLHADCDCRMQITDSRVIRDEDRPDNGDFFRVNDRCSDLFLLGNALVGGLDDDDGREWYEWLGISIGAALVLCFFCCCCYCWKKRNNEGKQKQAITAKSENINDLEDDDEDYETEEEEEYTEASDDEDAYEEPESEEEVPSSERRQRRR